MLSTNNRSISFLRALLNEKKKEKKNTQISKQPPLKSQKMGTKGKEKRSLLRLTDTGMQCTFGVEPRIPVPILSWRFHNYPSEKFFFIFDIKFFLPLLEDDAGCVFIYPASDV